MHISQDCGAIIEQLSNSDVSLSFYSKYRRSSKFPKLIQKFFYSIKYLILILRIRPDIFYFNTIFNFEEIFISGLLRRPMIMHVHEPKSTISFFAVYLRFMAFLRPKIIVVSNATLVSLLPFFRKESISLIRNGTDFSKSKFFHKEFGEVINISVVASIDRNKSQIEAIEILNLLKNLCPQKLIKLNFFGKKIDFDYFNEIEDCIKNMGIQNDVVFHGEVDRSVIYTLTDILLVTSIEESFSLVVIEAFSCSVPVVSTRNDGAKEIIKHGINGQLYNYGDRMTAAYLISKITDDKLFRFNTTYCAFVDARKSYGIDRTASEIISYINESI